MPTVPYYNSKGERVPGVTTVKGNLGWSNRALNYWSWQQGYDQCKAGKPFQYGDTLEKAAEAGTIAHAMIEADIKGEVFDSDGYDAELVSLAETAFLNFLQWKENYKFVPVETEPHLVSENYQFGGTPDMIAEINGVLCLFDWKTSGGLYEDYLIQLAAYGQLWNENHPDNPIIGGYHILRVDKETATFTHKYIYNLDSAWRVFLQLLELHNAHKVLKKLVK